MKKVFTLKQCVLIYFPSFWKSYHQPVTISSISHAPHIGRMFVKFATERVLEVFGQEIFRSCIDDKQGWYVRQLRFLISFQIRMTQIVPIRFRFERWNNRQFSVGCWAQSGLLFRRESIWLIICFQRNQHSVLSCSARSIRTFMGIMEIRKCEHTRIGMQTMVGCSTHH